MKVTKSTLKRALRTFIQSALAYLMVNALYINYTDSRAGIENAVIGLAVSAASAGIAGVMNLERNEK